MPKSSIYIDSREEKWKRHYSGFLAFKANTHCTHHRAPVAAPKVENEDWWTPIIYADPSKYRPFAKKATKRWWSARTGIDEFFQHNPNIPKALDAARSALRTAFGYVPSVEVRIISDPESNSKSALAAIKYVGEYKEAEDRLDQFRESWWYDHMQDAGFLLTFMLDTYGR